MDYQFGFKVSETWFFQLLQKNLPLLALAQLAVLFLSTTVVFVDAQVTRTNPSWFMTARFSRENTALGWRNPPSARAGPLSQLQFTLQSATDPAVAAGWP